MKVIHSWLKEYLGESLPEVKKVEEILTFHSFEVEEKTIVEGEEVIEIKVLPDRASDCLSHRGIARELATILDTKLVKDPLVIISELKQTDKVSVQIEDTKACPRFTASLITGIEVKESPEWLKKRLRVLGQRPINNIVDATNYVMFALGQPMHAYDADAFQQVDGRCQFFVRFANSGETVQLLAEGGKNEDRIVELNGTELLIVDGHTNTPIGLAGIKGGSFAELNVDTKNIIIEAAHFDATTIRKTARRLGILTDASKRFENGPSPELAFYAQQEIVALILDIAGGNFEGLIDIYPTKHSQKSVTVFVDHVNALLGLSLSKQKIKKFIEQTGSIVMEEYGGVFNVTPPWERVDLTIEANFIDEVGRIHGFSDVKAVVPNPVPLLELNARQYYSDKIRALLILKGFSEVITSSFRKKGNIQLQNSLASDKSCLREDLIKNISQVLDMNCVHKDLLGIPDIRVFEIGTVFSLTEDGIGEHTALSLGVRTKGDGYHPKDDVLLKTACEEIEKIVGNKLQWKIERGVAELDLSLAISGLSVPSNYESLPVKPTITYKPVSPYPAISRDIALWVNETELVDTVAKTLLEVAGDMCVRQTLFDTFTKEGRNSYAFRMVFQAKDRTLTDLEVNAIMEIVYKMASKHGWEVR